MVSTSSVSHPGSTRAFSYCTGRVGSQRFSHWYLVGGSGAQASSLGAATGGLAAGLEAAGGAAQDHAGRPGPWLWQGWPWGAAAAEGGRHLNRLEGTHDGTRGRCPPG